MSKLSHTLFARYIKDRLGQEIVENDFGFIIYKINGKECFIAEMSIEVDSRGCGHGRELFLELEEIASKSHCEMITANIHLFDSEAISTLNASYAVGFKMAAAEKNIITVLKMVGG